MLTLLFADTLVIKGTTKPCHVLIKAKNLPEAFHNIEETVCNDLDSSLKFDTSHSSNPYLYKVDLDFKEITSSECDVVVNIFDNATKELSHTYHLKAKQGTSKKERWRTLSHMISDFIFEKIQQIHGHFSSKIAFVKRYNTDHNSDDSIKSRLFICDYDGHNQRMLVEYQYIILGINFSKDGRYLVYRTIHPRKGQEAYVYDLKTDTKTNVSALIHKHLDKDVFGKNISAMSFGTSPDELLFARSHKGSTTLHAYHMKTKKLHSLTQPQRYIIQTCPAKSADGNTLFFSADTYGRENIYCLRNGSYIQRLPMNETLDFSQPLLCENVRGGKRRIFFSGRGRGYSSIWFVDENENFDNLIPTPIVTMQKPYFLEKPCPAKSGEYVYYLQNKRPMMIDVKGNEIIKPGTYIPLLDQIGHNITDLAVY